MMRTRAVTPDRVVAAAALVLAATAPLYVSNYWLGQLLTQMLFLGIAAASLIFLSAYGGMVSLAQVAIYGIAGAFRSAKGNRHIHRRTSDSSESKLDHMAARICQDTELRDNYTVNRLLPFGEVQPWCGRFIGDSWH